MASIFALAFTATIELSVLAIAVTVFERVMLLQYLPVALFLVLLQSMFTIGVSFWLAAANVRYKDVEYLTSVFLLAYFYLTPILYPPSFVPDTPVLGTSVTWQDIALANPMARFVMAYRNIFYDVRLPGLEHDAVARRVVAARLRPRFPLLRSPLRPLRRGDVSRLVRVSPTGPAADLRRALDEPDGHVAVVADHVSDDELTVLVDVFGEAGIASASPLPLATSGRQRYPLHAMLPQAPTLALPCRTLTVLNREALFGLGDPRPDATTTEELLIAVAERLLQRGWRHVAAPGLAMDWDHTDSATIGSRPPHGADRSSLSWWGRRTSDSRTHQSWAASRIGRLKSSSTAHASPTTPTPEHSTSWSRSLVNSHSPDHPPTSCLPYRRFDVGSKCRGGGHLRRRTRSIPHRAR